MRKVPGLRLRAMMCAAIGCAVTFAPPAFARRPITSEQTLLDRIQIEDLMASYYYNLGDGDPKVYSEYYTDDFVFDVNGKVYRGFAGLQQAYHAEDQSAPYPAPRGVYHMLMSNPLIEVHGDTATARFIWTGFQSDSVKGPPRPVQQGREYDVLSKRGGEWFVSKRTIISDAGLEDEFNAIYQPRMNYDPLKN